MKIKFMRFYDVENPHNIDLRNLLRLDLAFISPRFPRLVVMPYFISGSHEVHGGAPTDIWSKSGVRLNRIDETSQISKYIDPYETVTYRLRGRTLVPVSISRFEYADELSQVDYA